MSHLIAVQIKASALIQGQVTQIYKKTTLHK